MTARGCCTNFARTTSRVMCALLTFLCSVAATAAEHSTRWYAEEYRHRSDTRFGVINALALASDGYLWLGTSSGLFRFDGAQFIPWGARGEPPLPLQNIRSVLSTHDGCVWVGFSESGVTTICGGQVRTYSPPDGITEGYVSTLIETRDGAVWIGGRGGAARYYKRRWDRATSFGLPVAIVYSLYEDRRGWLWVGTSEGVFLRKPDGTHFDHFSKDTVRAFREDAAGTLWATDAERLARTLYPIRSAGLGKEGIGVSLFNDRFGGMWIGTMGQGLFRVERPDNHQLLRIRRVGEHDESDDAVLAIVADTEANVWVATRTGLKRYFEHGATMITRRNGLTNNTVRAVQASADGRIWVGTVGGIDVFNRDDPPRMVEHYSVRGNITALHAGPDGHMWVATDSTIGIFSNGRFSPLPASAKIPQGEVYAIATDPDGMAWLCHFGGGTLSRWDGRTLRALDDPAIPRQRCMDIATDSQGRMWIGFSGGHISVYENERFSSLGPADRVPNASLHALYGDRDGTIWVGTSEGLSRVRDRRIATFTQANGLPGRYVSAVIDDDDDGLWLVIDSRIIRVAKSEFDRASTDAAYRVGYTSFERSDGVLEASFPSGAPMITKDARGKLWFQTAAGVAVIDPRHVRPRNPDIRTRIERLVLDGKPIWPIPSHLWVPSGTSSIEIDYTAVSLSSAAKLTFDYQLEGFDKQWIDAGGRRQAFYTDLPPDKYRFRVRASINGMHSSETPWEMTIAPAFYQQTWFRALVIIAAAAAAWAAWALRVRGLKTQFRLVLNERTRIGREVHDTLLQSLAGMAMQMESLARRVRSAPDSATEDLRHLRRQAQRHVREARELISDLRRPSPDSFSLADALEEFVRTEVGTDHALCEVELIGQRRRLPPETEWELFRIAQEALRNAVRHAQAERVRVTLQYETTWFRLRITDNGQGFDLDAVTATQAGRWGLIGMQERARKVGAQLSIISSPQGTEVVVDLPYAQAVGVA